MKVMVFTPTWVRGDGSLAMRPEVEAALAAQDYEGEMVRVVGTFNPFPGQSHRNVLAQYQRAREEFLAGDCGALLTVEHDVVVPADGLSNLVETLEGGWGEGEKGGRGAGEIGVVFGVYMLRHGSGVCNAWEFIGDHAMGESLTLYPKDLAAARAAGVVRVSGVGWGCTLIRREVVERIRFHTGGDMNAAGDIAFAMDCLYQGVVMVADMRVACDHFDGELRLGAFGGDMSGYVKVVAQQDVVVMDGQGSRQLERGEEYEMQLGLANDLARAGYVRIRNYELGITNGEGGEGGNSAVEGREGVETGEGEPGVELAAVEANERAVVGKGRRRKGGKGAGEKGDGDAR